MEEYRFDFTSIQEKQKEALRMSLSTPVLFYGGAKGGGKSWLVRTREIARRLRYDKSKGLIVRKTYPELRSNHITKMFQEYPVLKKWYNKSDKVINYPNGSITEFSYLKGTDDVYTYQGREYEDISVDEVTQHEEEVFKILRTSLRTTRSDIKPTMLLTGNPGGVGHQWVKRIFIDENYRQGENPSDFNFVQAFVHDNKALMEADPEYIKRLEDLPEHLRKAYLEGDWNIFAGQAFPELNRSVHVIDPIPLPPNTRYFASFDPGYNHPFSFIIFAVVPEGTVYVVQHYTDRLKTSLEITKELKELVGKKNLQVHTGHDFWYPGRGGGPSQAEEFAQLGFIPPKYAFVKAKTDRKSRVRQIRKYVNPKNYPDGKPRLFFFSNCADVFDVVASMQIDPKDPEDVVKVDAVDGQGGDDPYDAFGYGLMSRAFPNKIEDEAYEDDSGMKMVMDHIENKQRWRDSL